MHSQTIFKYINLIDKSLNLLFIFANDNNY